MAGPLEVSQATVEGLAGKLDAFAAGLADEERALLFAVISEGVTAMAPEVEGFTSVPAGTPLDQTRIPGIGDLLLSLTEGASGGSAGGGTRPVIFGPPPVPVPGSGSG